MIKDCTDTSEPTKQCLEVFTIYPTTFPVLQSFNYFEEHPEYFVAKLTY